MQVVIRIFFLNTLSPEFKSFSLPLDGDWCKYFLSSAMSQKKEITTQRKKKSLPIRDELNLDMGSCRQLCMCAMCLDDDQSLTPNKC